jgi:5-methylcytosine-specific restriction endonuclease McrA
VEPDSRGGAYSWMNLVAACGPCNARKANRTPEEAAMPLLYLPYVPNRHEAFLLEGRRIRADVHEWLAARLPRHSRLH